MFLRLLNEWGDTMTPTAIATKVKTFFRFYAINRHKATVLTPACHAESYSPDDNRYGIGVGYMGKGFGVGKEEEYKGGGVYRRKSEKVEE